MAKGLEGLRRQDGIHAAAVVITKRAAHRVPADPAQARGRAGTPSDAPVVTQYEMHGVEDLGLLKMDFLGLRNLDVITDTRRADPRRPRRSTSTSTTSPLDDDADASSCCGRGDSIGVFQLEGGADARAHALAGARRSFDDVAALVALYRPGPDGGQHAQRLRRPQERPQADRVPPPRRSRSSSATPTG